MKKTLLIMLASVALAGCDTDSNIASRNLSKAADMFEINRRIVFYNGITDQYILTIEGKCSIDTNASNTSFHVTCKTGPNEYKKHFLGLSDNVTYFAEQLDGVDVSTYHYRVVFKPQVIVPDVDFRGSTKGLLK
ncbi:hypothetical protein JHL22_05180 [Advenella sp. WQ 585]|uniref:Lipoprotein n=1 Tax=Advenella mandrilli TaxID=2800330 RepID=A0ABS1E9Y4_9BURK|nr:hypothetical protein [Advenella mandrilli]MBK1780604.1 hypothetical protein [Advenella mandrilli]